MSKEWYSRYAKTTGVEISKENKELIPEGLERNKQKHGARYCPCRISRTSENICPCKEMRETKKCCCGLFITKEPTN